jgi:hypothetical protein
MSTAAWAIAVPKANTKLQCPLSGFSYCPIQEWFWASMKNIEYEINSAQGAYSIKK